MENKELMRSAREALKGKWGIAIAVFIVYSILMGSGTIMTQMHHAVSIGVGLAPILIGGPLAFGAAVFSLAIARGQQEKFEQLFDGFKYFGNTLAAYWLIILYVVLWSFLLIVPGIIAALNYSMTFYLLADNPSLRPAEALAQSKKMMDGHKWKLFYLWLRFLGLAILCILTLGIGFLWLTPFANVTMAGFYEDVKAGSPEFV